MKSESWANYWNIKAKSHAEEQSPGWPKALSSTTFVVLINI